MNNRKKPAGFTLVELIIVIAIVAVLASLAFLSLSSETAQARDAKRVSDLKTFEDAIATSNAKNKEIAFQKLSSSVQKTSYETNTGFLRPLRGAYLVPIETGLFDSDILPSITIDPRKNSYLSAFLSKTDYQLLATKENPDTKTPTALVRGSFKTGAIIDVLMRESGSQNLVFFVGNPQRFVKGDIIEIDEEEMTIDSFNTVNGTVTVTARGTAILHNNKAKIKLKTPRQGAEGLVCLGDIVNADTEALISNDTDWDSAMVGASKPGVICKTGSSYPVVVPDGTVIPYKVTR